MEYIASPYVWISALAWAAFAFLGFSHFENTERLREYIDNHHPDWWFRLIEGRWWRRPRFSALKPAAQLEWLIYFGTAIPNREPDSEFDQLLARARRSALIAVIAMAIAIVSAGWLPFGRR
jgi:hypothetical protein